MQNISSRIEDKDERIYEFLRQAFNLRIRRNLIMLDDEIKVMND